MSKRKKTESQRREAARRRNCRPSPHPGIQIPEADRERYMHMTPDAYWSMVLGEDPDDRAIREAHGFTYEDYDSDPWGRSLACRNGCGLTYDNVMSGKIRECQGLTLVTELGMVRDMHLVQR